MPIPASARPPPPRRPPPQASRLNSDMIKLYRDSPCSTPARPPADTPITVDDEGEDMDHNSTLEDQRTVSAEPGTAGQRVMHSAGDREAATGSIASLADKQSPEYSGVSTPGMSEMCGKRLDLCAIYRYRY